MSLQCCDGVSHKYMKMFLLIFLTLFLSRTVWNNFPVLKISAFNSSSHVENFHHHDTDDDDDDDDVAAAILLHYCRRFVLCFFAT